jgi:WD40 repeat protein
MNYKVTQQYCISTPGKRTKSLFMHPNGQDIVSIMGNCILVTSLNNPTNQHYLRAHDDEITCLAVSHQGQLLASGQKGNNSDVLIWDFNAGEVRFKLSEHDYEVTCVSFSKDDRLLFSCGNFMDKKVFIWDTVSGCIVASCMFPKPINCVTWGGFIRDLKWRETSEYQFATCSGKSINMWRLNAKVGSLDSELLSLGQTQREFTCVTFGEDEERELIAGTSSADFIVIDMKNKSLKENNPIGSMGVTAVCTISPTQLAVGCGNGTLAMYKNNGLCWQLEYQQSLGHLISGLSYCNGRLIAVNNFSQTIVIDINTKKSYLWQEGHNGSINTVRFADGRTNSFATASDDGSIRFWDTKNNLGVGHISLPKSGSPLYMQITDDIMIRYFLVF